MDKKQVIIWGKGFGMNGQDTLIFKNCTSVEMNGQHGGSLHFRYHGVSTGVKSVAIFKMSEIAGWAVGDMNESV